MNVLVERYQRRKYVNQEDSQMLYYVRQKSGTVRVMDVNKLANAIEANSSLTAGDVKHSSAYADRLPGEPPAGRWLRDHPQGAAALHGRPGSYGSHPQEGLSLSFSTKRS